jgi:hypothetical protein
MRFVGENDKNVVERAKEQLSVALFTYIAFSWCVLLLVFFVFVFLKYEDFLPF